MNAGDRWLSGPGRALFPRLPARTPLNRAIRQAHAALVTVARAIARRLGALAAAGKIIDATAVPLRNAKRRGVGVLPDLAAIGHSRRLGCFAGVTLLAAVTPAG